MPAGWKPSVTNRAVSYLIYLRTPVGEGQVHWAITHLPGSSSSGASITFFSFLPAPPPGSEAICCLLQGARSLKADHFPSSPAHVQWDLMASHGVLTIRTGFSKCGIPYRLTGSSLFLRGQRPPGSSSTKAGRECGSQHPTARFFSSGSCSYSAVSVACSSDSQGLRTFQRGKMLRRGAEETALDTW